MSLHAELSNQTQHQKYSLSVKKRKQKKKTLHNRNDSKDLTTHHHNASYDKKAIFKDIATHFSDWSAWQRQILLCKCTEQSSIPFLTSLATILEPILHRDFDIVTHGKFKSSLIKNFLILPSITYSPLISHRAPTGSQEHLSCSSQSTHNIDIKTSQKNEYPFKIETFEAALQKTLPFHAHARPRKTDSLSTIEFFNDINKQNVQDSIKFKKICGDRPGHLSIRNYKHEKWCLPNIKSNQKFNSVSKKSLLRSFNIAVNRFMEKYIAWRNVDKGDFFLHMVDFCSPNDLVYLAHCINQRLRDIGDIERLPDNLLVRIFTYLDCVDLAETAQVNKRWKILSSSEMLWKTMSYDLANKYNQLDFLTYLETSSVALNWKVLYQELKDSVEQLVIKNKEIEDEDVSAEEIEMSESSDTTDTNMVLNSYESSEIDVNNSIYMLDSDDKNDSLSNDSLCLQTSRIISNQLITSSSQLMNNKREPKFKKKKSLEEDGKDFAYDVRPKLVQPNNRGKNEKEHEGLPGEQFAQVTITGLITLKRVRKLEGHFEAVLCLQFDTKRIMSGSADRMVRLWDVRSGRNFHKLKGHQGGVRSIYFDDRYIVTGSWDTTVKIWHVVKFTLLHTITAHDGCVTSVEMNDEILVTASHDCTVCVFEKHTWNHMATLKAHQGPVSCAVLVEENQLLTGSFDRLVLLWDLSTCEVIKSFKGPFNSIQTVKLYGNLLAAGSLDGTITFWDFDTCQMEAMVEAHDGAVNAVCFVGSRFITGGGDGVVKEWDLSTCVCLRSFTGHKGPVNCVRASSKRIISGSSDGTIRVWDMACRIHQAGGPYDEMNKNIIESEVLHEKEYKKRVLKNTNL